MSHQHRIRKSALVLFWVVGLTGPLLWAVRMYFGSPAQIDTEATNFVLHYDDQGRLDISRLVREHCNAPVPNEENAAYRLVQLPGLEQSGPSPFTVARIRRKYTTHPWTSSQYPDFAEQLEKKKPYLDFWREAVQLPRMSKPVGIGVGLWDIQSRLAVGINLLECQTMLDAGENRWEAAIADIRSIDKAAQHFAAVQGGWQFNTAISYRERATELVWKLLLSEHCPQSVVDFVQERSDWDWKAALQHATNTAMRIQALERIERRRDDPSFLSWLSPRLNQEQRIADLQTQQIMNSIDWSTVVRLNNTFIDDYIEILMTQNPEQVGKSLLELRDSTQDWIPKTDVPEAEGFLPHATEKMARLMAIRQTYSICFPARHTHKKLFGCAELTKFCLRLNEYRTVHGRFPDSHDQLTDKYPDTPDQVSYSFDGRTIALRSLTSRRRFSHELSPRSLQ